MSDVTAGSQEQIEVYTGVARAFHWLTALLILVQLPVGFYMVYRGTDLKIWDSITGTLYDSHKVLGVIILAVIVFRLLYRLVKGAPQEPASLAAWERVASTLTHWAIYLLLILVPVLGYVGTAMYGALKPFGAFSIPNLIGKNKELSAVVFEYHAYAAIALLALIVLHILAAIYHRVIRKDLVVARMLPGLLKKTA